MFYIEFFVQSNAQIIGFRAPGIPKLNIKYLVYFEYQLLPEVVEIRFWQYVKIAIVNR
jgi:hypothetical protein